MPKRTSSIVRIVTSLLAGSFSAGCESTYKGVVKPVPKLSVLSAEFENLTDSKIETYLTADVHPVFPSVLAVAKVAPRYGGSY